MKRPITAGENYIALLKAIQKRNPDKQIHIPTLAELSGIDTKNKKSKNVCCRCDGTIYGSGEKMEPVIQVKKGEKYEHFPTKKERVATENLLKHREPGCSPYTKERFYVDEEDGEENLSNKLRILKRKNLRGIDWVKQELMMLCKFNVCQVNNKFAFEKNAIIELTEHYGNSISINEFNEIKDNAIRNDVKRVIEIYLDNRRSFNV
jgi:hypothetical protein